ncbi:MAG: thioesterase [Oscillibacter sp.]|nr:thioesterase [Oscillibacter sp.]
MQDFKQELYENGYFRQEELVFADCDRNKKARVATLLSKAAAYAGYDYDARGLTHDKLMELHQAFLLSRLSMRIHRCPGVRDVLDITTKENGAKGAHVQRVFTIQDQQGDLCASIKSDWILVDPVSRKILRPSAFTAKPLYTCEEEIDCPDPKKIVMPKENLEELGVRKVMWSDLDGNGHLYSGNYGDIIWDFLPQDLQEEPLKDFYINYSKEATLGEEMRIVGYREGNTYRMEGIGPHDVCFTALCEFQDRNA